MPTNNQVKFSFIIPIYNVQQYLSDCLESIKRQTIDDYEIICVNDGSTDNSLAIAEDFKRNNPNIETIIINQENGGPSAARNSGLNQANGKYVWFVDSDDYIAPHSLRILSEAITDNPDIVMFNCESQLAKQKERKKERNYLQSAEYNNGWEYFEHLAGKQYKISFVSVWCRIYKKKLLIDNQIDFKQGVIHEDVLFTPIVCYHSQRVKVIDAVLYNYHINVNSIMHTPGIHHYESYANIANELSKFFIPVRDIDKTVIYKYISSYFRRIYIDGNRSMDKYLMSIIDKKSFIITSTASIKSLIACLLILLNPQISRVLLHSKQKQ